MYSSGRREASAFGAAVEAVEGTGGCALFAAVGLGGGGGDVLFAAAGIAFVFALTVGAALTGGVALRFGTSVEDDAAPPGERPRLGGAGGGRTAGAEDGCGGTGPVLPDGVGGGGGTRIWPAGVAPSVDEALFHVPVDPTLPAVDGKSCTSKKLEHLCTTH